MLAFRSESNASVFTCVLWVSNYAVQCHSTTVLVTDPWVCTVLVTDPRVCIGQKICLFNLKARSAQAKNTVSEAIAVHLFIKAFLSCSHLDFLILNFHHACLSQYWALKDLTRKCKIYSVYLWDFLYSLLFSYVRWKPMKWEQKIDKDTHEMQMTVSFNVEDC